MNVLWHDHAVFTHMHSTTSDETRAAVAGAVGGGEEREEQGEEERGEQGEEEADTEQRRRSSTAGSDSMVSTASSSSEELTALATQRKGWVNFDDDKPPLPPPRSQLDDVGSGAVLANPNAVESRTDPFIDFNPFSRLDTGTSDGQGGRRSPFEDFGASIAETLFSQSRNRTSLDAYTANLMESAGREIYMALDTRHTIPERRESEVSLPEPLIPTSSSTSVASSDSTCTSNFSSTNPFTPPPLKSSANGFPSSQSHPLLQQREWVRQPRGPPPPKPQPYSGKSAFAMKASDNTGDPFGNLLEGISMQAYASGPKCSSPSVTSPQHSGHTPVETPLV